jgi:hypothetical protein
MRSRTFAVAILAVVVSSLALAHDYDSSHWPQFQFFEDFIKNTWHYPVQTLDVSMECPAEATNTGETGPAVPRVRRLFTKEGNRFSN